MDYQNIEKFVHKLSMLDLTNQNYIITLIKELKLEATDACNKHMEYHCEYCDCREYDRMIKIIKIIIKQLELWVE